MPSGQSFTAQATIPRLWQYCNTLITTVKDPQSDENFTIDWTTVLAGDTINTSNWEVPSDMSASRAAIINTKTGTVTGLAGGQLGQQYFISNVIVTTTSKQTLVQNLLITIQAV